MANVFNNVKLKSPSNIKPSLSRYASGYVQDRMLDLTKNTAQSTSSMREMAKLSKQIFVQNSSICEYLSTNHEKKADIKHLLLKSLLGGVNLQVSAFESLNKQKGLEASKAKYEVGKSIKDIREKAEPVLSVLQKTPLAPMATKIKIALHASEFIGGIVDKMKPKSQEKDIGDDQKVASKPSSKVRPSLNVG